MLSTEEKIDLMQDLFVHPNSFFAKQAYIENIGVVFYPERTGTCQHTPKHRPRDCPDVREVPFSRRHMLEHLKGDSTYAPYQLSKEGTIKWVCIDIDGTSSIGQQALRSMVLELASLAHEQIGPKTFLVEQSGSKGYHIWFFFREPIHVERGFALGHMLTSQVEPIPGMTLEVYPKQTRNKLFGNTVKLPLGIHRKTGNRCWIVDAKFEPYENPWEQLQNVRRIPPSWIDKNVPVTQVEMKDRDYTGKYALPMCIAKILDEGASEGVRDEAAFRIACYLRDRGIPQKFAETMMHEWNEKNSPTLDDDQLLTKLESAYGEEYHWLPCGSPAFDPYCSSSCFFFESKVKKRWHNPTKDPRGIISYE